MTRVVAILAVLGCALMFTTGASAADISDATLANMGLADMQPLSDAEGMQVRGKFFDMNVFVHHNRVSTGGAISVSQINNVANRGGRFTNIGLVLVNVW